NNAIVRCGNKYPHEPTRYLQQSDERKQIAGTLDSDLRRNQCVDCKTKHQFVAFISASLFQFQRRPRSGAAQPSSRRPGMEDTTRSVLQRQRGFRCVLARWKTVADGEITFR